MTDGWGDASGIEGNYEEEDHEADSNETSEVSETVETSSSTETTGSTSMSETSETNKTKSNIKDEWNGRTIYIPDDVLDEMEDIYLESQLKLRKADQDEFKKNRHFYPLLVQFGVEALAEADAQEIQARLSELGEE
jgi:negative regulator of genetic competence, sporulation and motility